jgi:hypothetical protein
VGLGLVLVVRNAALASELPEALKAAGIEVCEVGDCVEPRTIWNAIHEGASAALDI